MAADREHETINPTTAWRAVQDRDAAYDGRFVYAVRTTGVYCRPSCASRRPLRANVEFFASPSDAEAAGFRACLRCKPKSEALESVTTRGIEAARAYLDLHHERLVPLAELAAHAKLSPSHLQRSFKRLVGVSPKDYQQAYRVSRFKSRLRAGDTVSRATYEAGFGSSSRVYEKSDRVLGMTPAAFRRGGSGVRIGYTIAESHVGRVLVAMTERGVCAVEIGSTDAEVERALRRDFPNATIEHDDESHHAWVRAVIERVRRPATVRHIPLDVSGSAFQMKVWAALQEIPAGERRTYSEVAASIGQPTATRAVARACATNRIAVVIPCHRVVRGDGDLAGYKWGVQRKAQLLEEETG
ncbi:MAG TPA: bifunctional DNA-binding transcriptional regulator/O6-methylguanine-DNA methyltransferase Ada [Gemmatimonadaceae bacterium]|nr:bifunctional DNA-binding transcriptional regulator/O6-methylguanine-DNA methyltransferase Ada [Gemmatimonadaceae bacterium]